MQAPAVDKTAEFSEVGKLFRKNALFLAIALIDLVWRFYYQYLILKHLRFSDYVSINILGSVIFLLAR